MLLVWDLDNTGLRRAAVDRKLCETLKRLCGVSIYHDGFRVWPYSTRGDDGLELNQRRVNNPTMRVSTNQSVGIEDRHQGTALAPQVQHVTGEAVAIASVDQGYPGEQAAQDAAAHHMPLDVVKLPEATKGLVLWPKRGVIERSNAWATRFRRLARDDA
jgi:hypothetical protein